jgi:hypothetical protein
MNVYTKVLKGIGYGLNREHLYELPLTINRVQGDTYVPSARDERTGKIYNFFNKGYVYNTFIFMIISWRIFYGISKIFTGDNIDTLGLMSMQILITVQYLLGIKYFNKKHFYLKSEKDSDTKYETYIILPIILGVLITVGSIIFLTLDKKVFIYSDIYESSGDISKIFITLLMILDVIYTDQILITNCFVFAINILYHKRKIDKFTKDIEKMISDSSTSHSKISKISISLGRLRDSYGETVDHMSLILGSLNIIGFLHVWFVLNAISKKEYFWINIIYSIIFIMTIIFYIFALQSVKTAIGGIDDLVTSNPFIASHASTTSDEGNIEEEAKEVSTAIIDTTNIANIHRAVAELHIKISHYDRKNDWTSLRDLIKKPWPAFYIFGIEMDDIKILSKLFGVVIVFFIGKDIGSNLEYW